MARLALRAGASLLLTAGAFVAPLSLAAFAGGWPWVLLPLATVPAWIGLVLLLARVLWPAEPRVQPVLAVLGASVLVGAMIPIGFIADYAITLSANLCGADGSSTGSQGLYGLAAVYLAGGLWACSGPSRRVAWALPLAFAAGWVALVAITYAIPSNHGSFCET
jgi:hypothetical protein